MTPVFERRHDSERFAMVEQATIVSGALSGFRRCLHEQGVDGNALARSQGVPDGAWEDPDVEIPLRTFVRLYEAGSEEAGLSDLGWSTGAAFDLRNLGTFGASVLSAPNIGTALKTFENFLQLVQSETEIKLRVDGSTATVTYRILNPDIWPRRQDAEFTLSILANLIRRSAGRDWAPEEFSFEHGPTRMEQVWNETTGTKCRFGDAVNSMSFPVGLLDLPLVGADKDKYRDLHRTLNSDLVLQNRQTPVRKRVATLIYSRLGSPWIDVDSIASALGLSRRTLHRRLVAEDTGFSEILDDCRFRLAKRYLASPRHSLSDIALSLSYSDQSAFGRAFRRRCGMTPQQYRQHELSATLALRNSSASPLV